MVRSKYLTFRITGAVVRSPHRIRYSVVSGFDLADSRQRYHAEDDIRAYSHLPNRGGAKDGALVVRKSVQNLIIT